MAKRKNPFDDSYVLQKMHVGVKEVNLGVNHVENMKRVYDNTMKMLYNGTTINQNGILKLQNGMPSFQKGNLPFQNGDGHKNASHLLQSIISNKQEKAVHLNNCCKSNIPKHCFFCERIMCIYCLRICQECENEFCHLCSILQYDADYETAVCLSCT